MSPTDAKKIIESLANGIDPETGEVLSDQSPFNNPQAIRALFVALKALDKMVRREHRKSSLPENAGRAWSDEEDKKLLSAFDAGVTVKEIGHNHVRTNGAIASRLVRLGRIKERVEAHARD